MTGRFFFWLATVLAAPVQSAGAGDPSSWDAGLYLYPEIARLQADSPLNPGNQAAGLAESSLTTELRLNFKYTADAWQLRLRPLLAARTEDDGKAAEHSREAYLGQWQLRARLGESWNASLGREVMNWGPAQFHSPSSPFYFDNGRANPLRELSGVDNLKFAWTPDNQFALSLAWVQDGGRHSENPASADPWSNTWLAKADLRGDDWAAGLALAQGQGAHPFLGLHAQWTLNDAWLLYGELGSSRRTDALISPADLGQPFQAAARSPRRSTALLGASRTFENGHTLILEWLHDGHGYQAAEADAYFARAAASPAEAGLALGKAPPLLGRDYLHLVWQSNLLEGDTYFRVMGSQNLSDHSRQLAVYADHALDGHWSLFVLGVVNLGDANKEFSSLIASSLSLGVRVALP